MGFNHATTSQLWNRYVYCDEEDPNSDFMGFAQSHLYHSQFDAISLRDDWVGALEGLGVSQKLRDGIMLPEFDDIRTTQSCRLWVKETMELVFTTLVHLDDDHREEFEGGKIALELAFTALSHLEDDLREELDRGESALKEGTGGRKKSNTSGLLAPISCKQSALEKKHSNTTPATLPKCNAPPVTATSAEAPEKLDGHTMTWHACNVHSVLACFI